MARASQVKSGLLLRILRYLETTGLIHVAKLQVAEQYTQQRQAAGGQGCRKAGSRRARNQA